MTSLHLLKSSPSHSCAKLSCFCSKFISKASVKRNLKLRNTRFVSVSSKLPEAESQSNVTKETRTPASWIEEKNRSIEGDDDMKFREEDGGWGSSIRNGVMTDYERNLSNQRETSMALNSEGLEGLILRAKLLLTLEGTFFLGFSPLILATVAFFSALIVDDASKIPISPLSYIDPYMLLEEENIYQMAPRLR